eukprot:9463478-Ditylum_brightwellii.AAC.1
MEKSFGGYVGGPVHTCLVIIENWDSIGDKSRLEWQVFNNMGNIIANGVDHGTIRENETERKRQGVKIREE